MNTWRFIAYDDHMRRSVRVSRLTPDFQNLTDAATIALQAGGGNSHEGASMALKGQQPKVVE